MKLQIITTEKATETPETRLSFEELKAATLKFKATSEYQQVMIVILRKIFEEHETKNSLKN